MGPTHVQAIPSCPVTLLAEQPRVLHAGACHAASLPVRMLGWLVAHGLASCLTTQPVQGGHYVANVKCDGRWYQCDDALITRIDEVAAHAPEAYMLFYKHLPN